MLSMANVRKGSGKKSRKASTQTFPLLVEAMLSPGFYPHRPRHVQLEETHISAVFLAGDLVYKIKKPVDFGFLDYSTLRKRAFWCRREVALNRRLAGELYLGTARIYLKGKRFSLEPPGRVVDCAVVMKRLPRSRLFSSLMAEGRATLAQSRRIAARVARFHSQAAEAPPRSRGIGVLRRNLDENFRQTEPYIGKTVSLSDYQTVYDYSRRFLAERLPLLRKRIRDGRIRDCHGDLHSQHICLVNGIVIYDCIEFSARLRLGDVAGEVAFLYMDLLFHRHPRLARAFAGEYIRRTGDWEVRLLLSFYACYRAVVREKVESFRFSDPNVPRARAREAKRRAARYFHLARDLAGRDAVPRLFAVGGLPGTGKSVLASAWARRLGAACLDSDVIRKKLARRQGARGGRREWLSGIYTREWTERTYGEMIGRAEALLREGRTVVLDATFNRRHFRRLAAAAARRNRARCVTVECTCPPAMVRKRIEGRSRGGSSVSDADWRVYLEMKKIYAPPRRATVRVNTNDAQEKSLAKIAAAAYPF
jgi:aminoglycoside phosphotransferase family enzyme/predicted kinase